MAAKEFGLNTTTEAGDFRMTMTLALDGYSGTEHTIMPFPLYKDVAKLMAASGITYTPTLIVSADLEGYFNTRTNPYSDSILTRFTPRWELDDRLQRSTSWMRDSQLRFPRFSASLTRFSNAASRCSKPTRSAGRSRVNACASWWAMVLPFSGSSQ